MARLRFRRNNCLVKVRSRRNKCIVFVCVFWCAFWTRFVRQSPLALFLPLLFRTTSTPTFFPVQWNFKFLQFFRLATTTHDSFSSKHTISFSTHAGSRHSFSFVRIFFSLSVSLCLCLSNCPACLSLSVECSSCLFSLSKFPRFLPLTY